MVSLVDIANVKLPTVPVRGQDVDVNGLTADHIAAIMFEMPEIRKIMSMKVADHEIVVALVARLPEAVALIIAAGTGHAGEKPHIDAARGLGIGEQYSLLEGILSATFPQGVKSFMDGVAALVNQSGARGWVPGMKSPEPSSGASPQAAQSETVGTVHPDS